MNKKQVVVIHGGDTFKTHEEYIAFLKEFIIDSVEYFSKSRWRDLLPETLGNEYEVISPKMPNKFNARYAEWKIWFEKLIPFLRDDVILIGASLGGIFLTKYLSENQLPHSIIATMLVAAPFDDKNSDYSLVDFNLPSSLEMLEKQGGKIFIYHSKDDPVVQYADMGKYQKALPSAHFMTFEDRGHFSQQEFPELVKDIKSL